MRAVPSVIAELGSIIVKGHVTFSNHLRQLVTDESKWLEPLRSLRSCMEGSLQVRVCCVIDNIITPNSP